jgi:hypothetical protein
MTTLVCIHGRGQYGKNPDDLRRKWAAGLNFGLTTVGRKTVNPDKIVFPFYGDLLEAKKLQAQQSGASIDLESAEAVRDQHISPLMPEKVAQVESDLLKSMADQAEVTEFESEGFEERLLKIPGARRLLQLIADRTNVDQEAIEAHLTDVAVYLKVAREEVLKVVRAELPPSDEPIVLIAHSLGSVVAHDLLQDTAIRDRTTLFVTAGSPLGLQACYKNLLAGNAVHPKVHAWASAFDPDDFVALGHPLAPLYGQPLEDLRVDNPPNKAHSIEYYLGHDRVAGRISEGLAA